jgi:carbon starvation protein
MPPEDYVAINTDPKIPLVASAESKNIGLARSAEELAILDGALTPHDRRLLGLKDDQSIAALAAAKLPASKLLALSNGSLHALGYEVELGATHATTLSDVDFARLGITVNELPGLSESAGEVVAARTGGGVSLAVGMARVFSGLPGMSTLLSYWYHFAIMFEALFILTTIDTGTRIGRFLVQELMTRASLKLGQSTSKSGGLVATLLIVAGFTYFILTGSISTIWPMFGIANQLLACTALCIATTILLREAPKRKYAWITLGPLLFVGTTTISAGIASIERIYLPMMRNAETRFAGTLNVGLVILLLAGVSLVMFGSARRWLAMLRQDPAPATT